MAQLSLAWVMAQASWIVPIPGSRNLARIKENAGAVQVKLTVCRTQPCTAVFQLRLTPTNTGSQLCCGLTLNPI